MSVKFCLLDIIICDKYDHLNGILFLDGGHYFDEKIHFCHGRRQDVNFVTYGHNIDNCMTLSME